MKQDRLCKGARRLRLFVFWPTQKQRWCLEKKDKEEEEEEDYNYDDYERSSSSSSS
jgi:hypothetical protein